MKLGISFRCLIRKITNSGITQQLHKQLRLLMFEQRFHMQTPVERKKFILLFFCIFHFASLIMKFNKHLNSTQPKIIPEL